MRASYNKLNIVDDHGETGSGAASNYMYLTCVNTLHRIVTLSSVQSIHWPCSTMSNERRHPNHTKSSSSSSSFVSWSDRRSPSLVGPTTARASPHYTSLKKRKRTTTIRNNRDTSSSSLWVDKYAPTCASDLCVAPNKVRQVRTWLEAAATDHSTCNGRLLVWVGSPGIGKSTTIRVLARELGWTLHEWNDTYSTQFLLQDYSPLLSVDQTNAMGSFEAFLQQAGAGYTPLHLESLEGRHERSVILLEELPNLYNRDVEERFRNMLTRHVQQSHVPTVLIYSNVQEGKHRPADLERLVDPSLLYSSAVWILQCHAVTKARMKQSLERICKNEPSIRTRQEHFWDEVHWQSAGDLRHAIMALQFRGRNAKKTRLTSGQKQADPYERDTKLSTFHALGKILYAKRKNNVIVNRGEQTPMDFDPESVMERSDMGLGGALTFLGYHAPAFFTDVDELSHTFELYSDAALFLDRSMQKDHSDPGIYPGAYAASLAGRAVAHTNKHPAPTEFRQFSAPKVFEVLRNRRQNEVTFRQLCQRLSIGTDHVALCTALGASRMFVRDTLPYLRKVLPREVESSLSNLYSYVHATDRNRPSNPSVEEAETLAEEQQQILALDDIVEDDDDFWSDDDYRAPAKLTYPRTQSLADPRPNDRETTLALSMSPKILSEPVDESPPPKPPTKAGRPLRDSPLVPRDPVEESPSPSMILLDV